MRLMWLERWTAMTVLLVVVNPQKGPLHVLIVHQERMKHLMHLQSVRNVLKTVTKIYWVIQRAVNVPVVLLMKSKVPPRVLPFPPDHIFGTNKFENANPDLFVLVKRSIELRAHPGRTQKRQDQLLALSVHPVRMQLLVVPQNATSATTMNTNPTRMLPNAFVFKKVITDRVRQLKFNAQQVKQEAAATQHV